MGGDDILFPYIIQKEALATPHKGHWVWNNYKSSYAENPALGPESKEIVEIKKGAFNQKSELKQEKGLKPTIVIPPANYECNCTDLAKKHRNTQEVIQPIV